MKARTIVTVLILAFVAAAVGYLVAKEIKRARAPEVAREEVSKAPTAEAGTAVVAPATPAASADVAPYEGNTRSASDRKVVVTYYYTSKR